MNRDALNYLASINDLRGNYPKAKVIFSKMLKIDSLNPQTYTKLARIADVQRDTVSRLIYLTKANRIAPEDPDISYDLGMLLIKKKLFESADTVLSSAIKADSLNIALTEALAKLRYSIKRYIEAGIIAAKAIKMGSSNADMVNFVGQAQYQLKQYKACIQTYAVFEGTANANETTYYFTALCYRQLGDILKSNEYLNKSIQDGISFNVPIYYQELSVNSERLNRFNTSITQLNKAEEFRAKMLSTTHVQGSMTKN